MDDSSANACDDELFHHVHSPDMISTAGIYSACTLVGARSGKSTASSAAVEYLDLFYLATKEASCL